MKDSFQIKSKERLDKVICIPFLLMILCDTKKKKEIKKHYKVCLKGGGGVNLNASESLTTIIEA